MKRILFCALTLASLWVAQSAFSIEPMGAPVAAATAASAASFPRSASAQSGTVVKIDAKSGELVLDGSRRFTFTPGGGVSVRLQNGATASMAEVKVGASVRLTVSKSPGYASSPVSELWIVE